VPATVEFYTDSDIKDAFYQKFALFEAEGKAALYYSG
jgi:hypothetical protein